MRTILLLVLLLTSSCSLLGSGEPDILRDIDDAQATLVDVATIYRPTNPSLAERLEIMAERVREVGAAIEAGGDATSLIESFASAIEGVQWSSDPDEQARVATALAVAVVVMRRAVQ